MAQVKHIFSLLVILIVSISTNAQESNIIMHTVNKGQTLYSISKLYGTTVEDIVKMNPESAATLSVGQLLRIPGKTDKKENEAVVRKSNDGTIYHTIQSGETLYRLSKMYGITTQEICDANPGLSTSNFRVGETICIPNVAKIPENNVTATEQEGKNGQSSKTIKHTVKKGETLYRIAKNYGIEISDIHAANPELKKSGC